MRAAGAHSGAYVVNLSTGETVFRWRQNRTRILASNTKLFTTTAALARYGTEGTLGTEVRGAGALAEDGVWRGDLYLRGGGDPTFGSRRYATRYYGAPGGTVEELAALLEEAGIERVDRPHPRRRVRLRLAARRARVGLRRLALGRSPERPGVQPRLRRRGRPLLAVNPPVFAAARLDAALEARGVRVRLVPRAGVTPTGANVLASVDSPPMERLVRITNKPSDNFFAEMLLKDLALQTGGQGTTAGGAAAAAGFARRLGAPARIVDGSGLSRANRASPYRVVKLLAAMHSRDEYDAFVNSLAIAGQDGTLSDRMRGGAARLRCRGKTGTLSNVSALSGYCEARSGDTYAYSILMNVVYPSGARRLQDSMLQSIAAISE